MSGCDKFIEKMQRELPDNCTVTDLVKAGFYLSDQAAYHARRRNLGPEYFRYPNRSIWYPKEGIIEYLKRNKHCEATE